MPRCVSVRLRGRDGDGVCACAKTTKSMQADARPSVLVRQPIVLELCNCIQLHCSEPTCGVLHARL
eukprot:9963455-Prorocentrum_lima.AAC.1